MFPSLEKKGYFQTGSLVAPELCQGLSADMSSRLESGEFSPAGIGSAGSYQVNPGIRRDRICWWDMERLSPAQTQYLTFLQKFQREAAEYFRLPLSDLEIFYAVYPEGGFYKRHVDNFEGRSRRLITAVLYLNDDWTAEAGGQLKIWPRGEGAEPVIVEPSAGTLACFITPDTPHEVLPAARERRSVVCWMGSRKYL